MNQYFSRCGTCEISPENSAGTVSFMNAGTRSGFLLSCCLLIAAALQNFRQPILLDDAYITFRAARNFSSGKGLVFNPEENLLSTSAPGYALILGSLNKTGL